jgi:hypothetical protein
MSNKPVIKIESLSDIEDLGEIGLEFCEHCKCKRETKMVEGYAEVKGKTYNLCILICLHCKNESVYSFNPS